MSLLMASDCLAWFHCLNTSFLKSESIAEVTFVLLKNIVKICLYKNCVEEEFTWLLGYDPDGIFFVQSQQSKHQNN